MALLLCGGFLLLAAAVTLVAFNRGLATQAATLTETGRSLSEALTAALDDGLVRNVALLAGAGAALGIAGGLWLVLGRSTTPSVGAAAAPVVGSPS